MRRVPKIRISAGYFEKDGDLDALPRTEGVQVMRLDDRALVIDTQVQANPMASFFLSMVLIGWFFLFLMTQKVNWWFLDITILLLAIPFTHSLYIGYLQSSHSPVLFDRERRKVYGSHRGVAFELDWSRVGPAIVSAPMVLKGGGYMTLYNLNLVQYAHGKPREASSIERGFLVSAGNGGTIGCMGLWEYFRRYMDERPDSLPPTEVQPQNRDWTHRWLERGAYGGFYAGYPMISHLREHGQPPFSFWIGILMVFCAPGLLLTYYDAWLRPQTRLDPAWTPALPEAKNPYQVIQPTAEDRMLREYAARSVMRRTLLLIGGGCAMWAWVAWQIAVSS